MDTNRVRERLLTTLRVASKLLLRLERQFHTIGNAWSIGILDAVTPDPLRILLPTFNTMTVGSWMERGRDCSFQNVSALPTAGNCIQTREELGGVLELYCGIRDSCSLIQLLRINHVCSWSPESCHTAKVHQNDKISMVFLLLNKIIATYIIIYRYHYCVAMFY